MERIIKSRSRVKKYGEVFTPELVVKKMCDMLQGENCERDVYAIETTFLEPCCGTGNFLAEILKRKFSHCKSADDGILALGSIYGMEIQPDNVRECRDRLYDMYAGRFGESKTAFEIIERNIALCDALVMMELCAQNETWDECLQAYRVRENEKQMSLFQEG